MNSLKELGALEQCPETPPSVHPLQLWHAWTSQEDPPPRAPLLSSSSLAPAGLKELKEHWGDLGSRQEGLGECVRSHWGILSDSRERHLRSPKSGALPQGGHPERPSARSAHMAAEPGPRAEFVFIQLKPWPPPHWWLPPGPVT